MSTPQTDFGTPFGSPVSSPSHSSCPTQTKEQKELFVWLNLVSANAEDASAENMQNIVQLSQTVPSLASSSCQKVVELIQEVARTRVYNPSLEKEAKTVINALKV